MARFEVTISEMQSTASKISQAANEFLEAANQVYSAAEALSSSWEGDSQVAFAAEQQQANAWYKKMTEIVNTYVEGLNAAAKNYEAADQASAAAIRSH